MRFLVDAQLPVRLVRLLQEAGHDVMHTRDLPQGNRTPDHEINRLAQSEGRVVITKDADFIDSHILQGLPPKLLLISTGNIGNPDLIRLVQRNLAGLIDALHGHDFVELSRNQITLHR